MAVSGSDIKESRYTKQLRDAGVTVFIGQDGANIPDGDVTVVVSTAIRRTTPSSSKRAGATFPIVHRAQMLARLGRDLDTLAVAGHPHGKTTTSSMLCQHRWTPWATIPPSSSAALCGLTAPTPIPVGGVLMWWRPTSPTSPSPTSPRAAAIVTNIEADHLDHYEGLEEIYAQFAAFLSGVREGGPIVVCGDDPKLVEVARGTGAP